MRITGTIDFCLEKGEYDQGDFCTIYYDDLYDLKHDLQRQLEEAREKIDIQKGHLELAISISDDSNIKLLCTALLEQLKDKN